MPGSRLSPQPLAINGAAERAGAQLSAMRLGDGVGHCYTSSADVDPQVSTICIGARTDGPMHASALCDDIATQRAGWDLCCGRLGCVRMLHGS